MGSPKFTNSNWSVKPRTDSNYFGAPRDLRNCSRTEVVTIFSHHLGYYCFFGRMGADRRLIFKFFPPLTPQMF